MKKIGIFLTLITGLFCNQMVFAVENARPLATDSRIKVVPYEEDNVVPIHATTFTTTQIRFGKGELIQNIQNGDLAAWTVSVQKGLGNMFFLKPTMVDSNTNMTVVTNRHTYYFHLISKGNLTNPKDSTYAIHFIYPAEVRTQMLANIKYNQQQKYIMLKAQKKPENYNWEYSFSGARSIMPLHIFDDGKFTYMQIQENKPIPAILAVDNIHGHESIVNYRRVGQYLVIQQLAPQFTLREGKNHVVSVFNNRLIKQLKVQNEV